VTVLVSVSLGFDFLQGKAKMTKIMQEKEKSNKKALTFHVLQCRRESDAVRIEETLRDLSAN
jgi:hypothetical protein